MAEPSRLHPVKHLGLAHCCEQGVGPYLAQYEEAIKVCRPVGIIRRLAKVLVKKIETNLTLDAICVGTVVDPQPLYFSDIALSPVLPCAHF